MEFIGEGFEPCPFHPFGHFGSNFAQASIVRGKFCSKYFPLFYLINYFVRHFINVICLHERNVQIKDRMGNDKKKEKVFVAFESCLRYVEMDSEVG